MGYIAKVTDKPVTHVLLTHYHAVRVLGASGYGTDTIMASRDTYDLIVERGQQDMDSEIGRFPRLFQAVESIHGLKIGRAHVCTPVTNAHLVCRHLLENKNTKTTQ